MEGTITLSVKQIILEHARNSVYLFNKHVIQAGVGK